MPDNICTLKFRANRDCKVFVDSDEVLSLEANKIVKYDLPYGEYFIGFVANDGAEIEEEECRIDVPSRLWKVEFPEAEERFQPTTSNATQEQPMEALFDSEGDNESLEPLEEEPTEPSSRHSILGDDIPNDSMSAPTVQEERNEINESELLGSILNDDDFKPGFQNPMSPRHPKASIDELKQRAKNKDTEAMIELGHHYMTGEGVEKNEEEGAHQYIKANMAGSLEGKFLTGLCGFRKIGFQVKGMEVNGFNLIVEAAEKGWPDAVKFLVEVYENGEGHVQPNAAEAAKWGAKIEALNSVSQKESQPARPSADNVLNFDELQEAIDLIRSNSGEDKQRGFALLMKLAEKGNKDALAEVGKCYLDGKGVNKSENTGFKYLEEAYKAGSVEARYRLGLCALFGKGMGRDQRLAVCALMRAAEHGSAAAMNMVGFCYANGKGVEANQQKANEWYECAADLGDPTALTHVSLSEEEKAMIPMSFGDWMRKHAEKGHGIAVYCLAKAYMAGNDMPKDISAAIKLLEKGTEVDYPAAIRQLGIQYMKGEGVEKDEEWAFRLLLGAAEMDDELAVQEVSRCYSKGIGVKKSSWNSLKWTSKKYRWAKI